VKPLLAVAQGFRGKHRDGDVAGKAAGVNELLVGAIHAGIDQHVFDRAVPAPQARGIVAHDFVGMKPAQELGDDGFVGVELGDVVPYIFVAAIPEQLELGAIRAQDRAVRPDPMERHGAVLECVIELVLPALRLLQRHPQSLQLLCLRDLWQRWEDVERIGVGAHGPRCLDLGCLWCGRVRGRECCRCNP